MSPAADGVDGGAPGGAPGDRAAEQSAQAGGGEPAGPQAPAAPVASPETAAAPAAAPATSPAAAGGGRARRPPLPTPPGLGGSLLPASWRVQLPIFDGPLDLLLHLIKANEVEITDIPVATVCDQFHEYLMLMEELNLDIAGEYIYEAAMLIHLKSRILLPRKKNLAGEEIEDDPRQELVERLLEYQRLKEAAQSLAEVDRVRGSIWTRQQGELELGESEEEIDLGDVSLFHLLGALKTALERYDREHPPVLHMNREVFSVRAQFDRLVRVLAAGRPYDLLDDLRQRSCRAEAVAAFLAVLELARLNLVQVHQTASGEVLLHRTTRALAESDREAIQS